MDARSEVLLAHVHPALVKVLRTAAQDQPFVVVYGVRTVEAEKNAVSTGHSTTMHSRHLPNKDGVSCAVDVAALINGKVSFAPGKELKVFGKIAAQVKAAGVQCGVPVEWGGDWKSFKDWGHFQLPWHDYP